jgi:hypothetical protein
MPLYLGALGPEMVRLGGELAMGSSELVHGRQRELDPRPHWGGSGARRSRSRRGKARGLRAGLRRGRRARHPRGARGSAASPCARLGRHAAAPVPEPFRTDGIRAGDRRDRTDPRAAHGISRSSRRSPNGCCAGWATSARPPEPPRPSDGSREPPTSPWCGWSRLGPASKPFTPSSTPAGRSLPRAKAMLGVEHRVSVRRPLHASQVAVRLANRCPGAPQEADPRSRR